MIFAHSCLPRIRAKCSTAWAEGWMGAGKLAVMNPVPKAKQLTQLSLVCH